jgi:hypothetical protein
MVGSKCDFFARYLTINGISNPGFRTIEKGDKSMSRRWQ